MPRQTREELLGAFGNMWDILFMGVSHDHALEWVG